MSTAWVGALFADVDRSKDSTTAQAVVPVVAISTATTEAKSHTEILVCTEIFPLAQVILTALPSDKYHSEHELMYM